MGRADYASELRWLYSLSNRGMKLDLGRMREAVLRRGHPTRSYPVIHVAGTNGKGSTSAMMERMLRAAGYKTGFFSSPHLHRFAERARVNGKERSDRELAERLRSQRLDTSLPFLTFFERAALLAMETFRDHGCEVVVLEVGLGGRLDATNVVERPELAVVTQIALEHTKILGDTHSAIASEKAGILGKGSPAVIGARQREARRVLARRARRKGGDAWLIGREFDAHPLEDGRAELRIGSDSSSYGLGLRGPHQADNAAVALAAMARLRERGWDIPADAARRGLRLARWPGRLEHIPAKEGRPAFLLDAAHNPDGVAALARYLGELGEAGDLPERSVLLFGALRDKDHAAMLGSLAGLFRRHIYASPRVERAADPAAFAALSPGRVARSVASGLAMAMRSAGPEGLVVVAGSIFLLEAVRREVLGVRADPPVAL